MQPSSRGKASRRRRPSFRRLYSSAHQQPPPPNPNPGAVVAIEEERAPESLWPMSPQTALRTKVGAPGTSDLAPWGTREGDYTEWSQDVRLLF
jgi:hypothetical protein